VSFTHLVVAVDGSRPASRAIDFALVLAAREHARVTFCGVFGVTDSSVPLDLGPYSALPAVEPVAESARLSCSRACEAARVHGVEAAAAVLEGSPARTIVRCASEQHADAIVLGTHARRGLARAFRGSVAADVVRSCGIPVFVVREEARVDGSGPIVVAVDGSPPSLAALDRAVAVARDEGCRLHLVHAFDDHDLARIPEHVGYDPLVAEAKAWQEVEDELRAFAELVRERGVPFTTELVRGVPAERIAASAARRDARFVAMGTHGRGALERIVFGSVVEGVLHEAKVPVMTVRDVAEPAP